MEYKNKKGFNNYLELAVIVPKIGQKNLLFVLRPHYKEETQKKFDKPEDVKMTKRLVEHDIDVFEDLFRNGGE